MQIVKLKGCKRCGGDLVLDRDYEGSYITCLQCSAVYVKKQVLLKRVPEPRRMYAR